MRHAATLLLALILLVPLAAAAESHAEFVRDLYLKHLEREPDPSGIDTYVGGLHAGRLNRAQVMRAILTSPEYAELVARKRAGATGDKQEEKKGAADPGGAADGAPGTDPAPGAGDRAGLDAVLGGAVAGRNPDGVTTPLEGYDGGKLADPNHRTPKYLFGRVAQRYALAGVKSHADAEALLKRMLPEMKAAGLEISNISRDKILVKTEIGWEWVDVVRGAGGGNPGWWWGSEGKPVSGGSAPPPASGGSSGGSTPGAPGGSPAGPGAPLSTVPDDPEVKDAPIDTSSDHAAILSAATWVMQKYNHLFVDHDDRGKCLEIMTKVIGALRAKGYDAFRVVNHPSRAMGDPWRYGSDALVLHGRIYDVYGAMGSRDCRPQVLDQGPNPAGRPRE